MYIASFSYFSSLFLQVWCVWSPAALWWNWSCFYVLRQVHHLSCPLLLPFRQRWRALSLIFPQHTSSTFPHLPLPPIAGAESRSKRYLWLQILVWGSRVTDLSVSPLTWALALLAWTQLMRTDNVDLMVLCIDYPSLVCGLMGIWLPSLFSCCRFHEY